MSVERKSGKAGLIIPFAIVGVLFAAWSVWWFVVAHQVKTHAERVAGELRADGYDVRWADLDVSGYPFRTFVQVREARFAAPSSGQAVTVPSLHAEANTYALGQWVFSAPEGLTFTRGAKGDVKIAGQAVRGSVSGVTRSPPKVVIELLKPTFTTAPGAEPFPLSSAGKVLFNLRPKEGQAGAGELLFRIEDGLPRAGGATAGVLGNRPFTSQWEGVLTDMSRLGAGAWPQSLVDWSAAGGGLTLLRSETTVAGTRMRAGSDRLSVGPDGRLRGVLTLELQGGARELAALGRTPKVDSRAAAAAAAIAAAQTARAQETQLTLVFEDGDTRVGPFRLAPAPKAF